MANAGWPDFGSCSWIGNPKMEGRAPLGQPRHVAISEIVTARERSLGSLSTKIAPSIQATSSPNFGNSWRNPHATGVVNGGTGPSHSLDRCGTRTGSRSRNWFLAADLSEPSLFNPDDGAPVAIWLLGDLWIRTHAMESYACPRGPRRRSRGLRGGQDPA